MSVESERAISGQTLIRPRFNCFTNPTSITAGFMAVNGPHSAWPRPYGVRSPIEIRRNTAPMRSITCGIPTGVKAMPNSCTGRILNISRLTMGGVVRTDTEMELAPCIERSAAISAPLFPRPITRAFCPLNAAPVVYCEEWSTTPTNSLMPPISAGWPVHTGRWR